VVRNEGWRHWLNSGCPINRNKWDERQNSSFNWILRIKKICGIKLKEKENFVKFWK
jgi:hypothetical protein